MSTSSASSLGAFSISLPVADLAASRAFYEKLGFSVTGGDEESWVIMVNGPAIIGLFHGMFDKTMLTFNPGWAHDESEIEDFVDVREIRANLAASGIAIETDSTTESDAGPASIVVIDPDGNPILIDQHR